MPGRRSQIQTGSVIVQRRSSEAVELVAGSWRVPGGVWRGARFCPASGAVRASGWLLPGFWRGTGFWLAPGAFWAAPGAFWAAPARNVGAGWYAGRCARHDTRRRTGARGTGFSVWGRLPPGRRGLKRREAPARNAVAVWYAGRCARHHTRHQAARARYGLLGVGSPSPWKAWIETPYP